MENQVIPLWQQTIATKKQSMKWLEKELNKLRRKDQKEKMVDISLFVVD